MAKKIADVQIHASEVGELVADDNLDVSVDLIDEQLYLGNLSCARDGDTLRRLSVTHVLTVDVVPLPRAVLERNNRVFEFVKLADVTKEDLISHLPATNQFIRDAVAGGGTVLVHCYFGVSRSAAVVIAYIMEKYGLCYEDAFSLVKSKRRFIAPNVGFAAQLRLFGHMGCRLDRDDPRYKQFRLKMAGQKLKQVKILPQLFADLVKPDPALIQERPDPIVYRCKKCRRIVASQSNIIPHIPKQIKVELAKKGIRPPPSKLTELNCPENGHILIEKLKNLASQVVETTKKFDELENSSNADSSEATNTHKDGGNPDTCDEEQSQVSSSFSEETLVEGWIADRVGPETCQRVWFVEPMSWMQRVHADAQGKLHCPKCHGKIGNFSWVMGCKCPCGQKVAPAFYLVPSKVEWSNIVQNVQLTV